MAGKDDKAKSRDFSMHEAARRMVEDIIVTPFFKRHGSHMPATIKLHAEIYEDKDFVVLKTSIPGVSEDLVDVSANVNSIDITLHSGKKSVRREGMLKHEDDIMLHSSYVTPSPINPEEVSVSCKDGVLEVKAPKLNLAE